VNRWVSTRHALKSIEVPRDTIAGRTATSAGSPAPSSSGSDRDLRTGGRSRRERTQLGVCRKAFRARAAIAFDSAKWFLIVGSTFGVVIGGMLLFYPNAEGALERFANQWVSPRR